MTSLISGLLFLVAYNWGGLAWWLKLALPQAAIAACLIGSWFLPVNGIAQRALQFSAAFLVGGALAAFGQVYQTGHDLYQLFFYWGLLILPWLLLFRRAELGLLALILFDLATAIYADLTIFEGMDREGYPNPHTTQSWALAVPAIINIVVLFLWKVASRRFPLSRWTRGALQVLAVAPATLLGIIDIGQDEPKLLFPVLFAASNLALLWGARRQRDEIGMVASLLSLNGFFVAAIGRWAASVLSDDIFILLVCTIAAAVGFGFSLYLIRREFKPITAAHNNAPLGLATSLLQSLGGLLIGILLAAFMFAAINDNDSRPMLLLGMGAALVAVSVIGNLFLKARLFTDLLILMLAIAGYVGLLAFFWGEIDFGAVALFSLAYAVVLYPLQRLPVHRFLSVLSALVIVCAWWWDRYPVPDDHWSTLQIPLLFGALILSFLWLVETTWPVVRAAYLAMDTGIVLMPLIWTALYAIQVSAWDRQPSGLPLSTMIYTMVFLPFIRLRLNFKNCLALPFISLLAYLTQASLVIAAAAYIEASYERRKIKQVGAALALLASLVLYFFVLWPDLVTKGILLLAMGAIILVIALFYRSPVAIASSRAPRWKLATSFATLVLVSAAINLAAWRNEQMIRDGRLVLLQLQQTDPRAFLLGDYLALSYPVEESLPNGEWQRLLDAVEQRGLRSGYMVFQVDDRNILHFRDLILDSFLSTEYPGDLAIRFRWRGGRADLPGGAWFYQEGTASQYNQAAYAALRVDLVSGAAILVGLADRNGQIFTAR